MKTCNHRGIVERGKFTYYGRCDCGWLGLERWSFNVASQDVREHEQKGR